jgi:hypothetical protein
MGKAQRVEDHEVGLDALRQAFLHAVVGMGGPQRRGQILHRREAHIQIALAGFQPEGRIVFPVPGWPTRITLSRRSPTVSRVLSRAANADLLHPRERVLGPFREAGTARRG